jgi:hypothetical protein
LDHRIRNLLLLFLTIAIFTSAFVAVRRAIAEHLDRSVELAMDYNDILRLSKMDGIKVNTLLKMFNNVGIRSIALPEDTLDSAEQRGDLTWFAGSDAFNVFRLTAKASTHFRNLLEHDAVNPSHYYMMFPNVSSYKKIAFETMLALGRSQVKEVNGLILDVSDDELDLAFLGVGLPQNIYAYLKGQGFKVLPRIKNSFRLTALKIPRKLNLQRIAFDDDIIIFDEEEILGYPYYLKETASELVSRNLAFGFIEFSEQLGDKTLARLMGERVIRIHSIPEDEMEIMTHSGALARWMRAVRERGVRLLYIRPFYRPDPGDTLTQTNLSYISDIADSLKGAGYSLDFARTPAPLKVYFIEALLIALGVLAGALLLIAKFAKVEDWVVYLSILGVVFLFFVFGFGGKLLVLRKLFALVAAVVFPSLAMISPLQRSGEQALEFSLAKKLTLFFEAFAIGAVGALFLTGLTSDTLFRVGAEQFSGVKIALIVPLAIIALYYLIEPTFDLTVKKALRLFNTSFSVGYVALFLLLSGFGALFILRSGNFGIAVPGFERHIRDLIETALAVRPRTKEFLLGYPALVLAVHYFGEISKDWLWLPLTAAAIAPISLVNTFSHAHSPLFISAVRSVNGLLLGLLFGILAILLIEVSKKFLARYQ